MPTDQSPIANTPEARENLPLRKGVKKPRLATMRLRLGWSKTIDGDEKTGFHRNKLDVTAGTSIFFPKKGKESFLWSDNGFMFQMSNNVNYRHWGKGVHSIGTEVGFRVPLLFVAPEIDVRVSGATGNGDSGAVVEGVITIGFMGDLIYFGASTPLFSGHKDIAQGATTFTVGFNLAWYPHILQSSHAASVPYDDLSK